jgi:hypothetical protein
MNGGEATREDGGPYGCGDRVSRAPIDAYVVSRLYVPACLVAKRASERVVAMVVVLCVSGAWRRSR